jgi:hypothetical protein
MKKKKRILLILAYCIIIFMITAVMPEAFTQLRNIDIGVGSLQITLSEVNAGASRFLDYPREYEVYTSQRCVRGEGILIGAKNFYSRAYYEDGYPNGEKEDKGWVVSNKLKKFDYFIIDATPTLLTDIIHHTVPVQGVFKKYWKYPPTTRIINNEDLSISGWDPALEEVDESIPTEQMGIVQLQTSMGITVTEKAYVLGNPDYDDFAIVEYVFKYTGTTPNVDSLGNTITYNNPIEDCYLGVKYLPVISDGDVVPHSGGWGENTDDWVEYVHNDNSDLLRVMYGWDGDASATVEDDEGDPLIYSSGVFLSPQYPGVSVLHADKAPDDPTNDTNQPQLSYVSWGAISAINCLSSGPQGPGMKAVYEIIENGGELTPALDWEKWNNNKTEDWMRGTNDPTKQYSSIGSLVFGPYQFDNVGDSVRIMLCHTVGTITWKEAIDYGKQWKEGTITTTEKNTILRHGRDSLFAKVKAIKDLFETSIGNYDFSLETLLQKVIAPPAWPDSVILSSVTGGCKVDWSEVDDAVSYRVYRRLKPDFYIEKPETETYPLVFQCGGTDPGQGVDYSSQIVTSWIDNNVVPAQYYWYYVTAINSDGVESSHFVTRTNPNSDDPTRGGVTPFEKPPQHLDSVYVVPNPYHCKAVRLYERIDDMLDFVGLPAACRIRIFSQNGDLIATIDHELQFPPSSSESWEMRTETNQTIASGLYVYVVDECKDHENNIIKETKVGKFVVIR